jgi:hypothetical protein
MLFPDWIDAEDTKDMHDDLGTLNFLLDDYLKHHSTDWQTINEIVQAMQCVLLGQRIPVELQRLSDNIIYSWWEADGRADQIKSVHELGVMP